MNAARVAGGCSLAMAAIWGLNRREISPATMTMTSAHASSPEIARAAAQYLYEASVRSSMQEELDALRPREDAMRQKWIEDEEGWHHLPSRAWPERQPDVSEIKVLRAMLRDGGCTEPAQPGSGKMKTACHNTYFDLASALVFNQVDMPGGFRVFKALAHLGSSEGMTAVGVMLIEGLGVEADAEAGVAMLREASEMGYAQAHYELGSVLYCGVEGVVEVDEDEALELFEEAAKSSHTCALYMVADHLLTNEQARVVAGFRCSSEGGRAVRLLHAAAERGHRQARQTLKKLLDDDLRKKQ